MGPPVQGAFNSPHISNAVGKHLAQRITDKDSLIPESRINQSCVNYKDELQAGVPVQYFDSPFKLVCLTTDGREQ